MALQFGPTKIGGMQYNGVTIGEAMYNGQIVYTSVSWPQGFVVGARDNAYAWWSSSSQWESVTSGDASARTAQVHPHPSYPETELTGAGISVPAGTYHIELASRTRGSETVNRGIRATLNGVTIPGLSTMKSYAGAGHTISISATVTIGGGVVSMDGGLAAAGLGGGLLTGSANHTWLTIAHV